MENRTQKLQNSAAFFQLFDHGAALKIKRKLSHLNIAFDRYASIGTVMHYILVISIRLIEMGEMIIVVNYRAVRKHM